MIITRLSFSILTMACCSVLGFSNPATAQVSLSDASINTLDGLTVERAVYDSTRDLIYATVSSASVNTNGDSIAVVNPNNGDFNFVTGAGSNPNAISLSDDDSLVYLGVDGDFGFRTFDPATSQFGAIQPLTVSTGSGVFINPATAEDFAIQPGNPGTVVVSADTAGNSANDNLQVFNETGLIDSIGFQDEEANSILFADSNTLLGLRSRISTAPLVEYLFDGAELIEQNVVNTTDLFFTSSGDTLELSGGNLFSSGGAVVTQDFELVGAFAGRLDVEVIEPIESLGITYLFNEGVLSVFDTDTFLLIDSLQTDLPSSLGEGLQARDLFVAGESLALVDEAGGLTLISGVPIGVSVRQWCGC